MKAGRRRFLRSASGWPVAVVGSKIFLGEATAQTVSTGTRLLHGFIRPAVQRFVQAADAMHGLLASTCAASNQLAFNPALQDAWRALVLAWSRLELLRFGPLVQGNRFERIFFWPDPRGVMLRQMRPLLQSAQHVPLDLRSHSVALQGLPALEYLLHADQGLLAESEQRTARCALAQSIARNLADIAGQLQRAWNDAHGYARDFGAPAEHNAIYRNDKEVTAEIIKALSAGLRFEGEVKLRAALGAQPDKARPRLLPFWRSDLSLLALAESVQALQDWHALSSFAREPDWLVENLNRELRESAALLRQHHAQAAGMNQDQEVYQTLRLTVLKLDNARRMVDEDLAPALGVGLGFNALDGD